MEEEVVVAGYRWQHHFGVFICNHVFEGAKVRLFSHEFNGDLQFLCGADNPDDFENCKLAGISHVMEHHPEIASLPDTKPGQWAERSNEDAEWIVGELGADDQNEGTNP